MPPELEAALTAHGGLFGFGALFVLKLGDMAWKYFRDREKLTDDSIKDLKCELEKTREALALAQSDMHKLKLDLRRCFYAVKKISGENWAKIADEFKNSEI